MLPYKISIAHAPALAALHRTAFDIPWTEEAFYTLLALPTTYGFICEDGFILCSYVLDEMEILTICTVPQKRRQGIARALLSIAEDFAKTQGVFRIFLEVAAQNKPAQDLYTTHGFIQTGRRNKYYKTTEGFDDALCLTKTLI